MKKEKAEKLFAALSELDDGVIDAARPAPESEKNGREKAPTTGDKPRKKPFGLRRIISLAACFLLVIALSLYLFIPFSTAPRISAYESDEYYPIIEAIAYAYFTPPRYKNNFERIGNSLGGLFLKKGATNDSAMPDYGANGAPPPTADGGTYTEVTDNQVEGVIEADIIKATDKHIFRLSVDRSGGPLVLCLTVYSADGEDARKLSELEISRSFNQNLAASYASEMFLSEDATRVTVIYYFTDEKAQVKTAVTSVDVSDVTAMSITDTVTVSGTYVDARMSEGRLLLVTDYTPRRSLIKYDTPATYVPSVTTEDGESLVPMDEIVMPESPELPDYSVVTLLDENGLEALDSMALYNFTESLYATADNLYLVNPYTATDGSGRGYDRSEIVAVSWADGRLESRGTLDVEGEIKDQYSLDEREGHLRVVTTTSFSRGTDGVRVFAENASLFVYDLEAMTLRTSVEYFAPKGESAESVRFDGDKLYVCTAIMIDPITYTDPVYFFDLSDYGKITYTDTGDIDGYSSSLIQLPSGDLLGIGEIDGYNKLEVYREQNGKVVSVDMLVFDGLAPTEYKAYYINRELGLFGMFVDNFELLDADGYYPIVDSPCGDYYVIFAYDGTSLSVLDCVWFDDASFPPDRARAAYLGDYLYITSDRGIVVYPLEITP